MKKRIVILCFDSLGDITLRQPLFGGLLDQGHEVTIVVREGYDRLISYLDQRLSVVITKAQGYQMPTLQTIAEVDKIKSAIETINPDIIVSTPFNYTYLDEWVLRLFPYVYRIGFANKKNQNAKLDKVSSIENYNFPQGECFSETIGCSEEMHEIEKNKLIFTKITKSQLQAYIPRIALPDNLVAESIELLKQWNLKPKKYVLGCPAGIINTALKAWPVDSYVQQIIYLHEKYQLSVLLTGIESERDYLTEIITKTTAKGIATHLSISPSEDIKTLLGLISQSQFYLGSDTSGMHFSAALDVPIVALFGGGTWPRFTPVAKHSFILTQKLPCFSCQWQCWLEKPFCINLVSPQKIHTAIDSILGDEEDKNQIDLGQELDVPTEEIIRSGLMAVQKLQNERIEMQSQFTHRINCLEHTVHQSEMCCAERLEAINTLDMQLNRIRQHPVIRACKFMARLMGGRRYIPLANEDANN